MTAYLETSEAKLLLVQRRADEMSSRDTILQNCAGTRQVNSPVLTDILWAIILPPITASPVHKTCPNVPPTATPKGFWKTRLFQNKSLHTGASLLLETLTSLAARMMVVSCDRSPHSARKDRVKAWMKIGEMKLYHLVWGRVIPVPASTSAVPLASLERCSCRQKILVLWIISWIMTHCGAEIVCLNAFFKTHSN